MICPHEQTKENSRGNLYTHPCGQCIACRVRKRQEWAARIMLEALYHPGNSLFLTLTYSPENYPLDGNLDKTHVQKWLKRLRKRLFGNKSGHLRYFACGEYGEKTGRAHYHAIIFGLPLTTDTEKCVNETWNLGFVSVSELNHTRAEYAAKYTTKKLELPSNSADGRVKEFALMSRRPGLGYASSQDVIRTLQSRNIALSSSHISESTANSMMTIPTFGGSFRLNGRLLPMDRYLKGQLRKTEGFDELSYQKTLENKAIDVSGGSVFQEVLNRADAKLASINRAEIIKRRQKIKESL